MPAGSISRLALRTAAVVAILFGIATVASGGRVLFGDGAEGAGSYVPFIVWFNFLAGFAYLVAGAGLWLRRAWAAWLALALAAATAAAFAALGWHIGTGGAYEMRTVAAMTLRLVVWLTIAALAFGFDLGQGRYRRT
ncbi:MAG: rane protein [Burkholderiales bacterium]|nr:rane protein [Burkholderiales bacterium]